MGRSLLQSRLLILVPSLRYESTEDGRRKTASDCRMSQEIDIEGKGRIDDGKTSPPPPPGKRHGRKSEFVMLRTYAPETWIPSYALSKN